MVMATPGGGFVFDYFPEAMTLEEILQMSHNLVLAHLPNGEVHTGRDQQLFYRIAEIYRNVEDSVGSSPFMCQREQVGMFLRLRIAPRFCLSYCSRWCQETVGANLTSII